jgi:tetratricopeptide (TPR) repeat protein
LIELGRLSDALQALDDCIEHGRRDAATFRARASLRTRLGQYAGAQTDFTHALEIAPDAGTYAARGWCYLVGDAPHFALPDFTEAIRLAPSQADAYAGRGYCRALLGESRLAVRDAEEARRLGPPSPRLDYNLARIYARAAGTVQGASIRLRSEWQDQALHLLKRALEAQSRPEAIRFWHNVVHTDQALDSLRSRPELRQLAARFPLQRSSPTIRERSP